MRSRSFFSPLDMQQILQKHTSVYCQQHLPNRPSTFDNACLLGSCGWYVKYVGDGTPVIGGMGNCIQRWPFLLHCIPFSLVFVGRDHVIPADDLSSCIAQYTDWFPRSTKSGHTQKLSIHLLSAFLCILVHGEVARQMGTMAISVQTSTVTIVTKLFLVQAAMLYIL